MSKKPGFAALIEAVVLMLVGLAIVVAAANARGDELADPPTSGLAPTSTLPESPAASEATATTARRPAGGAANLSRDGASGAQANATRGDASKDAFKNASKDLDEIIARQYDGSRERFRALGLDDSHFEKLLDGRPIVTDEHESLLLALNRLRDVSRRNFEKWTRRDVSWADVIADSRVADGGAVVRRYQGQIFPVAGRLTRVEVRRPLPRQVPFFVTPWYFRCEVTQDDGQPPVVVYTLSIPKGWHRGRSSEAGSQWTLDEPVRFSGVFLKMGPAEPEQNVIVMTRHLGWYPDQINPALGVAARHVLLARLGMDVGLFDGVANRKKNSGREEECFYQLLSLMGRLKPNEIERQAQYELRRLRDAWPKIADEFQKQSEAKDIKAKRRELLKRKSGAARLAAREAENGRFSVFPLFVLDHEQQGQLVTLEGIARRIIRVQVGDPINRPQWKQDLVARFRLDHYYEVYLFPNDSRNNPVVFCLREIPANLPTGDNLSEHLKITGVFYKSWPFRDRKPSGADNRQMAPLLIGRGLRWFPKTESETAGRQGPVIAIGLVVLAMVGLTFALSLWRRGDRKFKQVATAVNFSVRPGQSLNDLGLEADEGPDFSGLK